LTNFNNVNAWNFATWDAWAKNTSPNKNVKIYIGAPAAPTAAGSGYVDAATLASIAKTTRSQYSSFGGIMLWDASQAYANGRFDLAIKNAISTGAGGGTTTTSKTTTTTSKTTTTSTTTSKTTTTSSTTTTKPPTSGSCSGVAAWVSNIAYDGASQVTYNGHLWTAKWWSFGDTPGGAAGVWTDNGACTSLVAATAKVANTNDAKAAVVTKVSTVQKSDSDAKVKPIVATAKTAKATSAASDSASDSQSKRSRFFRL